MCIRLAGPHGYGARRPCCDEAAPLTYLRPAFVLRGYVGQALALPARVSAQLALPTTGMAAGGGRDERGGWNGGGAEPGV